MWGCYNEYMEKQKNLYHYGQNNSGGSFDTVDTIAEHLGYNDGDHNLYVYADSDEEADQIAQSHGVYFDGVNKGVDCGCCGDRWYRTFGPENEEE